MNATIREIKGNFTAHPYGVIETTIPWDGPEPQRGTEYPPVFFPNDHYIGAIKNWKNGPLGLWLQAQCDAADQYWRELKRRYEAGKLAPSPILVEKLTQFAGLKFIDSAQARPTVLTYSETAALYARSGLKLADFSPLATKQTARAYHYKAVHARMAPPELSWAVQRAVGDCAAELGLPNIRIAFFLPEDRDDLDDRAGYERAGLPVPWKSYSDSVPDLHGYVLVNDDAIRIHIDASLDPNNEERARFIAAHETRHAWQFRHPDEITGKSVQQLEADADDFGRMYIRAWRRGERWAMENGGY